MAAYPCPATQPLHGGPSYYTGFFRVGLTLSHLLLEVSGKTRALDRV